VARLQDEAELLAESDVSTYRGSGPGGQNRNKVESAVRIRHRPTGITAIAEESRSQAENRKRALRRLRKAIALHVRRPVAEDIVPQEIRACVDGKGRLGVGRRDERYLAAAASILDVLVAAEGSISTTAARLGLTTGNLSAFLTADEDLMAEANRVRADRGLRALGRK
jgi:RF-1 domain